MACGLGALLACRCDNQAGSATVAVPIWRVSCFNCVLAQLTFADCLKHKYVVAEIATESSPQLAVMYDEVLRFEWEDLSCKLGRKFDFSGRVGSRSEKCLRQAQCKLERFGVALSSVSHSRPAAVGYSPPQSQFGKPVLPPPPQPSHFKRRPDEAATVVQEKRPRVKCYKCYNKVHRFQHVAADCPDNKRAAGGRESVGCAFCPCVGFTSLVAGGKGR